MISFQTNIKGEHKTAPIQNIYGMVRNERIKAYTDRLNEKYADALVNGFNGYDKKPYQDDKANNFPVAMFSLNDVDRHTTAKITPEQHTGIINLDLDENTKEELATFRKQLHTLPYVQFCALSVSGQTTGHLWANILVELPKSRDELPGALQGAFPGEMWLDSLHKLYIDFVSFQLMVRFKIKVGSSKDLKRARYIGYDPNPYQNNKATPIPLSGVSGFFQSLPERQTATPPQRTEPLPRTVSDIIRKATLDTLERFNSGLFDDRDDFVNFCMACKSEGLRYEDIDGFLQRSKGYDKSGNEEVFNNLHPNGSIAFGTVVHLAKTTAPDFFKQRRNYYKALESQSTEDIQEGVGLATKMSFFLKKMYTFSYNMLTGKVQINGLPITDPLFAEIYCNMVDAGFKNTDMIRQVILRESTKKSFHPVHQYFKRLTWDNVERLNEEVIGSYLVDKDGIFWFVLRKWMIGAIAKAFTGSQNPMLVMAGAQGAGKSIFAKWLCPLPDMYLDAAISPDSADDNIRLTDRFLWEVSELGATTRRQDVEALKAFLTRERVTVRRPYDKFDIDKQALASFIGTINDDGIGFLNDTTGNRRFRVCHMDSIDWEYKTNLNVDLLWAEAYHVYKAKESIYLPADVNMIMQERMQNTFEHVDPIVDMFHNCFKITGDENDMVQTTEVLSAVKDEGYRGSNTRAESMALSRAMKKLGIERKKHAYARYYLGIAHKANYEK